MDSLATFLASFIVALITGLIAYFKTNRKSETLRKHNEIRQEGLLEENIVLTKRLGDLTAVVEDLRIQVKSLQHFKELYDTLKEAHTRLKEDHEELRRDFQSKVDSWNIINTDLENERIRSLTLEQEIDNLKVQLEVKEVEIRTFEKALDIIGKHREEGIE